MEEELQEDLNEALQGLNPVELLLTDSELSSIAQDIFDCIGIASEIGDQEDSTPQSPPLALSSEESNPVSPDSESPSDENIKSLTCQVCHKPAKGCRYFGAVVCFSCRSFFSRSAKNQKFKTFACSCGGLQEDVVFLLTCQMCRYAKCVKVGMRIPKTIEKRGQNRKVELVKRMMRAFGTRGASKAILAQTKIQLGPSPRLTLDELAKLEALTSKTLMSSYTNMVTLIASNIDVFRASIELYYQGKTFPIVLEKSVHDYMHYAASKNYYENAEYRIDNLSHKDRCRLVQGNIAMALEFVDAYRLNKKQNLHLEVEAFVDALKGIGDPEFNDAVTSIHSKVTQNGTLEPVAMTYDTVYNASNLCLETPESAERHRRAAMKAANLGTGPDRDWDPIHLILTCSIIMYCTDFIDLDDPGEAERVQLIYVGLLYKYLKLKKEPNMDWIFRESLLASSYAREMHEARENAFRKLKM